MRRHARHREALGRPRPLRLIAPATPFRIRHHRLPPHFMEGDVLRRMFSAEAIGIAAKTGPKTARPRPEPACRPSSHRPPRAGSRCRDDRSAAPAPAPCRKWSAPETPWHRPSPVAGLSSRTEEPMQPPITIRADHEEAVRIDRLARPDHGNPPARLAGDRMDIGHMLVTCQRMADQDGIAARGIQRAIGLVGNLQRLRGGTGFQHQGWSVPSRNTWECAHRLRGDVGSSAFRSPQDNQYTPRTPIHPNQRPEPPDLNHGTGPAMAAAPRSRLNSRPRKFGFSELFRLKDNIVR